MKKLLIIIIGIAVILLSGVVGAFECPSVIIDYTDVWQNKTDLPIPMSAQGCDVINNKIYCAGGRIFDSPIIEMNFTYVYDPASDNWTQKADMITSRADSAAKAINGKLYVIGGDIETPRSYMNTTEAYDPATDSWETKADCPLIHAGTEGVVYDNKLYIMGGCNTVLWGYNTTYVYDPVGDNWTQKADMPTGRCGNVEVVYDGKIHSFGGENTSNPTLNVHEVYDPVGDNWTTKASVPKGIKLCHAHVLYDNIHLICGFSGAYEQKHYIYNPATDTWSEGEPVPVKRSDFGYGQIVNEIYVIGGANETSDSNTKTVVVYKENKELENGTFTQARFWRDCYDIGLSYPDYANNSTKGEWSFRCNNSRDNSQYENDGTVYGATWNSSAGHTAYDVGAYEFNGGNDYIDLGSGGGVANTHSAFAWVYPKNLVAGQSRTPFMFRPATGDANQITLNIYGDELNIVITHSSGSGTGVKNYLTTSANLVINTWYHIGYTWDGTNLKLYIDGSERTDINKIADGSITMTDTTRNRWIGADTRSTSWFNGIIDEVYVYNRTLSADEIAFLNTTGLSYYATGNATYSNIELTCSLVNITINKTRNGTVRSYVDNTLECTLTDLDEGCVVSGTYTETMNTTLGFINYSTTNVNEIIIYEGVANCTCVNCTDCTDKLNNPSCNLVNLTADITDHSGTCISNPANFNNKVFDCQGHTIDGDDIGGTDYGIYLNRKENNTIKDCTINGFYDGIWFYASNNTNITNCTSNDNNVGIDLTKSSNNTLTNNTLNSNEDVGISLIQSFNITLNHNTANDNNYGIDLSYSTNSTLTNNTANNNQRNGLYLSRSASIDNILISNTFCSNNQAEGSYYDIKDADANSGDNNTCDTTSNWNDTGDEGCTYLCTLVKKCDCSDCLTSSDKLVEITPIIISLILIISILTYFIKKLNYKIK